MTGAPHHARDLTVVAGSQPGEVVIEFVRFDGRVVCGADSVVLSQEQVAFLTDALPTVGAGLARRAEDRRHRRSE